MPSGFFPAVGADAPVRPLLERLWPAVEAEMARYDGADVTVHAELRATRGADGDVGLERFYWSTQRPDPASPWGFAARTLYCDRRTESLRLHEFPSDPVLTWLGDRDGPLRRDGRPERVDVLRYIPLRRLTYRLHDGAGLPARVIGKAKGTGGLDRAAVACLAVNRAVSRRPSAVRIPRLLRMEPPRHALYLEELPGAPLPRAIGALDLTDAVAQLGSLHRGLQELEVKGLPVRRAVDWLADARAAVGRIELFAPSVADRARAAYAGLERSAPADAGLLFCQGDFLPGQVLYDPSGWSVIDFDDSRYADPHSDVAAMYAAMPRELGLDGERAEHARRTYLEAYAERAGAAFDPSRWRWFLVLLQLSELGKRLIKGRVAPGETDAVLDRLDAVDL